jgi:hypothetical protein
MIDRDVMSFALNLGFWLMIVVIFSSKILFSLSISVYRSTILITPNDITFLYLELLGLGLYMGVLDRLLLHDLQGLVRPHVVQALPMSEELFELPAPAEQFVLDWLVS